MIMLTVVEESGEQLLKSSHSHRWSMTPLPLVHRCSATPYFFICVDAQGGIRINPGGPECSIGGFLDGQPRTHLLVILARMYWCMDVCSHAVSNRIRYLTQKYCRYISSCWRHCLSPKFCRRTNMHVSEHNSVLNRCEETTLQLKLEQTTCPDCKDVCPKEWAPRYEARTMLT